MTKSENVSHLHTLDSVQSLSSKPARTESWNCRSQLNHVWTLPTKFLYQLQLHLFNLNICAWRGGYSSVIGRSLVEIPAPPGWVSCMSKCPWAWYWTPNCSWGPLRWASNLCRAYPAPTYTQRQLGLAPATNPTTPWKGDKVVTGNDMIWLLCMTSTAWLNSYCRLSLFVTRSAAQLLSSPHYVQSLPFSIQSSINLGLSIYDCARSHTIPDEPPFCHNPA